MKTKAIVSVLIGAAWLAGAVAEAQSPPLAPAYPPPAPLAPQASAKVQDDHLVPASGGLSDWILYRRECCEGPLGRYTPLYTELYLRSGAAIPVGGSTLGRELKTGWSIAGGAQAQFFNEPNTSAWVVDLHIINTAETGNRLATQFPLTFFRNGIRSDRPDAQQIPGRPTFSIQNYNRTLAGLGIGKNWYLRQPANSDGCTWRFGIDTGGRWGSGRLNFNEFGHTTDVIGSYYVGAHIGVEAPWHGFIFHAGARYEWAYTWSDILQRTSDVQDVSILLTAGMRW